jgi:hypothetical protein
LRGLPAQETYLGRRHAANLQLAKSGRIIRWPTPVGERVYLVGYGRNPAVLGTVKAKQPLTAKEEAALQMMTRNGLSWV